MPETNNENQYIIDVEGEKDPSKKKKVILSIDGGGMRGAITLAMLAELEKQSGKTCQEMFDMFVGTSTGAIISAGLAVGYSAQELQEKVKLYRDALPRAFKKNTVQFLVAALLALLFVIALIGIAIVSLYSLFSQHFLNDMLAVIVLVVSLIILGLLTYFVLTQKVMAIFALRVMSNLFRFAYPLEPFIEELKPLLKGKEKISDIEDKILLVTTKDVTKGETLFIVNKGAGAKKKKYTEWSIIDAVASSGAAPIFFPPVLNRFVDGGVSPFNNPCFIAAVEAMEYIGVEYGFEEGKVILVSLGTGYPPHGVTTDDAKGKNFFDWMHYIILEGIDDSLNQQVYLTRKLYGSGDKAKQSQIDFRRYNISLTREKIKDLGVSIPNDVKPEALGLDSFDEVSVQFMDDIGKAYANKIDWSKSDAMPWDFTGGQPDPSEE